MEAICKNYYPYDVKLQPNIKLSDQSFLTGNTYKITYRNFVNNQNWYQVENENGGRELFTEDEFNDYFLTLSEIRRLKLKKLKRKLEE